MTLQGFPAAILSAGIDLVTTLPAPITDLAPIVTPFKIMHLVPINTSSSMTIGALAEVIAYVALSFLFKELILWQSGSKIIVSALY